MSDLSHSREKTQLKPTLRDLQSKTPPSAPLLPQPPVIGDLSFTAPGQSSPGKSEISLATVTVPLESIKPSTDQ